jgi:membrane fusion protein (multidrug efflux system)
MLQTIIQTHFKIGLSLTKILTISLFAVLLSACGKTEVAQQAPPPAVSVYKIKTQEIGKYREFVARTVASKEANLRARVEGELLTRLFREGANVEAGQVLLKIDPAEYIASVAAKKADLTSKIAGANGAVRDLKRGREIAANGFISQSDLDKLITKEAQTKAAVRVANAALEKAELNLSYTNITAPFAGRIGKVNYNVGNVIGPTSDVLATLTLTNPINVSFQIEESLYISYLQENGQEQQTNGITKPRVNISIRLPNNSLYPEPGVLDFSDTKIDQSMGTVELRALFDNPNGIILPGLFVTLILESQAKEKMSLVPQAAVQENQQGKFVLVIKDNKVSQRHVVLGRRINAMWVVDSGLNLGEEVVIEGLQKVRSGVEVKSVYKAVDYLTGTISEITDNSGNAADERANL